MWRDRLTAKKRFDDLYDDPNVWADFVDEWIKRYPDRVDEIVSDWLENQLGSDYAISEEFNDFVTGMVEAEISQKEDEAYDRYKED